MKEITKFAIGVTAGTVGVLAISAVAKKYQQQKNVKNPFSGAAIFVNRGLYKHFGIYINDNRIIHFAPDNGYEKDQRNAYIHVSNLEDFQKNGTIEIDTARAKCSPKEVIARAEHCLGRGKGYYNLVFNNCEHFVRRCQTGVKKSYQVRNVSMIALAGIAIITSIAIAEKNENIKRTNGT
jgi:hypothetical protein